MEQEKHPYLQLLDELWKEIENENNRRKESKKVKKTSPTPLPTQKGIEFKHGE